MLIQGEEAGRIGMTKAIFMLYRRPNMSGDEFRDYWRNTHGPIAAKMPGLKKYVQNQALMTEEGEPPVAGIAEVYFDTVKAMQDALASRRVRRPSPICQTSPMRRRPLPLSWTRWI